MLRRKPRGSSRCCCGATACRRGRFSTYADAARAVLLAAEHENDDDPMNMPREEESTIQDLAHLIADEVGFMGDLIWDTGKPNGQPRRCLEVSRAKELFGFEAELMLRHGTNKSLAWVSISPNRGEDTWRVDVKGDPSFH